MRARRARARTRTRPCSSDTDDGGHGREHGERPVARSAAASRARPPRKAIRLRRLARRDRFRDGQDSAGQRMPSQAEHTRDQVSDGRGCSGGTVPSAASIQLSRSACVNPGHAGTSGSFHPTPIKPRSIRPHYARVARTRVHARGAYSFHFRPRFEGPLWEHLFSRLLPKICLKIENCMTLSSAAAL